MSVEQEGGGVLDVREEHSGGADHLPPQCASFITRTPPCPKALCVPWPFIRPCSEWFSSCVEKRVLERPTPLRGPTILSPAHWLEASMSTACLGRKSRATELHFLMKPDIKNSREKEKLIKDPRF